MDHENETTNSPELPSFTDHLVQAAFAVGATVVVYAGVFAICSIPSAVRGIKEGIKSHKAKTLTKE